jgi:thymidine kinase
MAKLTFYYSAMNAGKSAQLLQKSHNLESKGFKVKRHTFALDDRFGAGKIASRVGISAEAELFATDTDFCDNSNCASDYIFIDEAQFLTKKQVLQLTKLVDGHGITIFCYGLRTDFKGEPFEGATYLMAWSDEIHEIESYDGNGCKSMMNMRLNAEGERLWHGTQMQIGLNYESIHRGEFDLERALRTGLA